MPNSHLCLVATILDSMSYNIIFKSLWFAVQCGPVEGNTVWINSRKWENEYHLGMASENLVTHYCEL